MIQGIKALDYLYSLITLCHPASQISIGGQLRSTGECIVLIYHWLKPVKATKSICMSKGNKADS